MAKGRPSRLSTPGLAAAVAEAWVAGLTRKDIGEKFNCTVDTVSRWFKDPRVQAHAARIAQDRIIRIVRQTDTEIEVRLAQAEDMPTETLLKVRREYIERQLKVQDASSGGTPADAGTINEAIGMMEDNPEMVDEIKKMLEARTDGD